MKTSFLNGNMPLIRINIIFLITLLSTLSTLSLLTGLFVDQAFALRNQIKVQVINEIPVIDMKGVDYYDFHILSASQDEIYGTDLNVVGIYDFSGNLKKIIPTTLSGTLNLRDIKKVLKVKDQYGENKYFALDDDCLIEVENGKWQLNKHRGFPNYNAHKLKNTHIVDFGSDSKGNIYALHRWGQPNVSVLRAGSDEFTHFPPIPQFDQRIHKDRRSQNFEFYVTGNGTTIISAHISDSKTNKTIELFSKDQKTYLPFEGLEMKKLQLIGVTGRDDVLFKPTNYYYGDLKRLFLFNISDGSRTLPSIHKDPLISKYHNKPEDVSVRGAYLYSNGFFCFDVGSRKNIYCAKKLGMPLALINKNEDNVEVVYGAVLVVNDKD